MEDEDLLQFLIDTLDKASGDRDFGIRNQLVRVEIREDDPDGFELGLRDIADHPTCELLGFTAPPTWRVLGVIGGAWAGPMAEPGELQTRPSSHPDGMWVRMIILHARSGARASRLRWPDGRVLDMPGEGTIDDCLRRGLGLTTSPPTSPPDEFVAVRWLDSVLGRHSNRARKGPPPAHVDSWDDIRCQLVQGAFGDTYELTAAQAAWMDAGMLARWLLGGHKPLGVLLREVDARFSPAVARRLRSTVSQLLDRPQDIAG